MRVSLQGDVELRTVACDCHSLAVCIPQKCSSDSPSWPQSCVSRCSCNWLQEAHEELLESIWKNLTDYKQA